MDGGWATPAGYPAGIKQKTLGERHRRDPQDGQPHAAPALRPGAYTTAPFVHDHWEEVYLSPAT
jgi:hypothetical protein